MIKEYPSIKYNRNITSSFFGIPLEDVFPKNDLHPTIKNLFYQAYENATRDDNYCVEKIIKYLQGSLDERLKLKEKVASHLPIYSHNTSSGALIWVIRHFVGLLPLPLLPRYSGCSEFDWAFLADQCKMILNDRTIETDDYQKIIRDILIEVNKLPQQNRLLLFNLLGFLRSLIVHPHKEPIVNICSAICLAHYFTNSIFCRPYQPGFVTKKDKRYLHLVLFLILKWPEFRDNINTNYTTNRSCPNLLSFVKKDRSSCMFKKNINLMDNSTQTCYNEYNVPNFNYSKYLKDISCQTDTFVINYSHAHTTVVQNRKETYCYCCGSQHYHKIDVRDEYKDKNQPSNRKNVCCCTYSTNYTSLQPNIENTSMGEQINSYNSESVLSINKIVDNICNEYEAEGMRNPLNPNNNIENNVLSNLNILSTKKENKRLCMMMHSPIFLKNDQYIYDDFVGQCESLSFSLNFENDNCCYNNMATLISPSVENKDLTERVSKIGWSYTSPNIKSTFLKNDSSTISPAKIGWNIPKSNYSIYFDNKEKLDFNEKDRCENAHSSSDNILSSLDRETDLCSDDSRSVSSYVKFEKIKSQLEFIKLLNLKKMRLKKTTSYENIHSNIKYQKMTSARSTIF